MVIVDMHCLLSLAKYDENNLSRKIVRFQYSIRRFLKIEKKENAICQPRGQVCLRRMCDPTRRRTKRAPGVQASREKLRHAPREN